MDWLSREPEDRQLGAAQLTTVVCQVRHEQTPSVSDPDTALRVYESLDWAAELGETLGQGIVITGPGPLSASQSTVRGWQLQSKDSVWIATLMPDSFALETRSYSSWKEFFSKLEGLLVAMEKHVGPALEHRTGLRFQNRFVSSLVGTPRDWKTRIAPILFQAELYEGLDSNLRAALQVLEIQAPDEHLLLVRHGCQRDPEGTLSYILDNDCSRQKTRAFSVDSVKSTVQGLHLLALRAFEMATTREFRDELAEGLV